MRSVILEYAIYFFTTALYFVHGQDLTICGQISTFFPNMCQYSMLKSKCPSLCLKESQGAKQHLSCGRRATYKRKRSRRIVGGTLSDEGQWPWHISLWYTGYNHTCGGSILSENIIITAAHCVDNNNTRDSPKNFTVLAGTNEHQVSIQQVKVKKIIKHKDYEYFLTRWSDLYFVYVKHDIALLILDGKLNLGMQNKDPICLPDQLNRIPEKYQCYIVGFGMTEFMGNKSDRLRHTSINTVPVETCNRPESFNNTVNSSMTICGGDGTAKVSPCQYDSGGGLVCKKNGVWYLTGIISSGYKCGGENAYSMYTNVAQYKDWIAQKLIEYDNSTIEGTTTNGARGAGMVSLFTFVFVLLSFTMI